MFSRDLPSSGKNSILMVDAASTDRSLAFEALRKFLELSYPGVPIFSGNLDQDEELEDLLKTQDPALVAFLGDVALTNPDIRLVQGLLEARRKVAWIFQGDEDINYDPRVIFHRADERIQNNAALGWAALYPSSTADHVFDLQRPLVPDALLRDLEEGSIVRLAHPAEYQTRRGSMVSLASGARLVLHGKWGVSHYLTLETLKDDGNMQTRNEVSRHARGLPLACRTVTNFEVYLETSRRLQASEEAAPDPELLKAS